jgi:hypothetical protein
MAFDAEKEVNKLWRALHGAQDEIGKTFYRWRKVALDLAGPEADPLEVSLKAAGAFGEEIGKGMLPRLNWLKGEEAWLIGLGQAIAGNWTNHGAVVTLGKGKDNSEMLITWSRCPWPTHAKNYGVKMEEDVRCCDRILESLLVDVNLFFRTSYKIETLKAIPRGQGACVRRLYRA